jgi:5-methylcytosine-specific restriction endonuclease McrA
MSGCSGGGKIEMTSEQKLNRDVALRRWVVETRLFQRIAGVPETPVVDLIADWESWNSRRRVRELDSIRDIVPSKTFARRG